MDEELIPEEYLEHGLCDLLILRTEKGSKLRNWNSLPIRKTLFRSGQGVNCNV